MRHLLAYLFLGLLGLYLLSSCNERNPEDLIDPEFATYVENFFVEGEKRNVNLRGEIGNFSVHFGDLGGIPANGVCSLATKDIVIHVKRWDAMSDRQRERLIFHELGHCLLDRPHLEEVLTNGECRSIMKGAEGDNCTPNVISDLWHEYYKDELFIPSTPAPDWYVRELSYETVASLIDTTVLNTNFLYYKPEASLDNYVMNATFIEWTENQRIEVVWNDFRFLVSESIAAISYKNEFLYIKREIIPLKTTAIGLVEQDGLTHFILNGDIFHTMESLGAATDFTLNVVSGLTNAKIPLELEVTSIK